MTLNGLMCDLFNSDTVRRHGNKLCIKQVTAVSQESKLKVKDAAPGEAQCFLWQVNAHTDGRAHPVPGPSVSDPLSVPTVGFAAG